MINANTHRFAKDVSPTYAIRTSVVGISKYGHIHDKVFFGIFIQAYDRRIVPPTPGNSLSPSLSR